MERATERKTLKSIKKIAHNQNWQCPICSEPLFNREELNTHHIVPVA